MEPLVSIGMSIFNCGKTLCPTVRSLLNQAYENWELILIDDGSTDNTLRLAGSFNDPRIKLISDGTNRKLAARLNQAVALSRGKYFARLDGGDVAYPERLAVQVRFLEAHPQVDLVASRIIIFSGEGSVIGSYIYRETHEKICRRPGASFYLPHPTWMGRVEWFRTHRYREDMDKAQDEELLLRTYRNSCFACIPDILLGYRKDFLSLNAILHTRYCLSLALLKRAYLDRHPRMAVGVLEHALKALIEIFSITTGLDYRVLRHRSIPVEEAEIVRWEQVWRDCNQRNDCLDRTER
ncbi:MAG: glycosyltransferase [Desulfobacterales bacterium]|nr:glycosyltransferase [Desulfobacterales bacterium]